MDEKDRLLEVCLLSLEDTFGLDIKPIRAVAENPELVLLAIPPAIPSVQMAISALLSGAEVHHTIDYRPEGDVDIWRIEELRDIRWQSA